ncbi:MAG: hypothetical protein AAB721_02985 [Patescibacteria group bacterium]
MSTFVPSFKGLATEVGELVERKQAAYGDSFGRSGAVLRALYPSGVSPEQLDDALTITRIVDKLFRIATDRDALGESPWRDIMGYALLAARRVEIDKLVPMPSEEAVTAIVREVLASGADPFAAATRRAGHYFGEAQRWQRKYEALITASKGVGSE